MRGSPRHTFIWKREGFAWVTKYRKRRKSPRLDTAFGHLARLDCGRGLHLSAPSRCEIVGYSMCREFGRGRVVGPIVASDDDDANHLTAVHLRTLTGQFARVDTREKAKFAEFLQQSRLAVYETATAGLKPPSRMEATSRSPIVEDE